SMRELRLAKGSILCRQGEPASPQLLVVADGEVELSLTTPDGATSLLRSLGPAGSLGNTALLADVSCEYTAVAKEDGWALTLSRQVTGCEGRGRGEFGEGREEAGGGRGGGGGEVGERGVGGV
ncbi:MAG: hypothetical protein SGPRY_014466, partial [Prymnesium sp.]